MASSENPPTDLILDFFPEPKNIHHVDPEPHIHLHSMGETCRRPDCSWIRLSNITSLASHAPHLHAEPELSGIGVILGFMLTAYLTLLLLIVHYFLIYNPLKKGRGGTSYTNPVDGRLLTSIRGTFIWEPSKRFEYALERSVLLLSDTQLVTGLALLISGYSQLNCGISAYHWQLMVYVAWFASFTFLSAMSFLQTFFETNHSLRLLRAFFMFILATLLIVALLPTGSRNWLDLADEGGGFFPALSAKCYFEQLTLSTYTHGELRVWSMVLSVLVVGMSYLLGGIKLFDPTSEITRSYLRAWPGRYAKRFLCILEQRAARKGVISSLWMTVFLLCFCTFCIARASWDIAGSMLAEIIWIGFAIAWGTIKLLTTRQSAGYNYEGEEVDANPDVLTENYWSFGQILPLILLLLPVLSMLQAYLDNEAKAYSEKFHHQSNTPRRRMSQEPETSDLNSIHISPSSIAKPSGTRRPSKSIQPSEPSRTGSTSCPLYRCRHHQSPPVSRAQSRERSPPNSNATTALPRTSQPHSLLPPLPTHPYSLQHFHSLPWYTDLLTLLVLETLMVCAFILALLNAFGSFLGISWILRSRLFLVWILGMIPLSAAALLGSWWIAALSVRVWRRVRGKERRIGGEKEPEIREEVGEPLGEETPSGGFTQGEEEKKSNKWMPEQILYWALRLFLISGWVVFTFFMSFEISGPKALLFDAR